MDSWILTAGPSFNPSETYTLTQRGGVVRGSDGAFVPEDAGNADWRAFLAWRASGRTPAPDPAPAAPEVPAEVPLWALRATLKETGKFAAIDAFVEAHKDDQPTLWEAWNMGNTVVRDSMLISQFAPQFGIDAAARDALLIAAAALSS